MSNFSNLVGLPYIAGRQDCYGLMRRYYDQVWDIQLPNFARPNQFWNDPSLDLYSLYSDYGFEPVFDARWEIGDTLLMPLRTQIATHAAMIVEDNKVLHHLPGKLSTIEPLRPRWGNLATTVIRHPEVTKAQKQSIQTVHLHEVADAHLFRDPEFQKAAERALRTRPGAVRGDHSEG